MTFAEWKRTFRIEGRRGKLKWQIAFFGKRKYLLCRAQLKLGLCFKCILRVWKELLILKARSPAALAMGSLTLTEIILININKFHPV